MRDNVSGGMLPVEHVRDVDGDGVTREAAVGGAEGTKEADISLGTTVEEAELEEQ